MKALIIGAGAAGSIVAKLLAGRAEIKQMYCRGHRFKKGRKFITPDPKITFKFLNARTIRQFLKPPRDRICW